MFGRYAEAETHREFAAFVAQWETDGRKLLPDEPVRELKVRDIVARLLERAEGYYRRKDGTDTGETRSLVGAVRRLLRLYGSDRPPSSTSAC